MLTEWVFNQGQDGIWQATTRDNYFQLFNGSKGDVLRSSSIDTLISMINKTKGNKAEIEKLLNES